LLPLYLSVNISATLRQGLPSVCMVQTNTLLQNRYRIIRQVGKGGMGTVYMAKDENLGTTVAVKQNVLTEQKLIDAFRREARLLASLRHSALPQVKDHFIIDGTGQFLVMEFIAGDDLETILEKRRTKIAPAGVVKPFEIEQIVNWAEQLLDALDYLHTRQDPIIHRDIKPQNLKLADRNQIILLDFGLAKGNPAEMTQMTTVGSLYGYTPNYAPIEQIRGIGTDPRSDLYALGATLYHLITGLPPVDAATRADVFLGGELDILRPPHELNPQTPQAISMIVMKAMEQHRNNRPASAAGMLQMLRAAKYANLSSPQAHPNDVAKDSLSEVTQIRGRAPKTGEPQTSPKIETRFQQEGLTQRQPERITFQPQIEDQALGTNLTSIEQNRSAKRKWLLIGGVSLLSIVLAVVAFLFLSRYSGKTQRPGNKAESSTSSSSNTSIFKTPGKVFDVTVSDDGQTLMADCNETSIRLWQGNVEKELFGQTDIGRCVAISHDGQTAISGSQDGTVHLWRLKTESVTNVFTAHYDYIFDIGFSPDEQTFYTVAGDQAIKFWRTSDSEPLATIDTPETDFLVVAVSPDLKLAGFYHPDGRFKLWSTTDNSFLRHLEGNVPAVTCGAFSADSQVLALGSGDGKMQLWDTGEGRLMKSLEKSEFAVNSVAFTMNGQTLAAGFHNGTIKLWRVSDGKLLKTLEGHTGAVNSLSFNANGQILVSGSDDSSVRIWNLESSATKQSE
jgi:eukaryotic-like serine/threonine-protein kinase